jgi:AAA+ ATPase superfamily predicted ATPase
MKIIGREREIAELQRFAESGRPEFVAVTGRRRVGKTFLISSFFKDRFTFYYTGTPGANNREQLRSFGDALRQYGAAGNTPPKNWFDAFRSVDG